MTDYKIGERLEFDDEDQLPKSKIVGIDLYSLQAQDGLTREWESYTLIAEEDIGGFKLGDKFYAVALPDLGMCRVDLISPQNLPRSLDVEPKLSGSGTVVSTGQAVQGDGQNMTVLMTYWDKSVSPPQMYADEVFNGDEVEKLYFRTNPLKGLVVVHA